MNDRKNLAMAIDDNRSISLILWLVGVFFIAAVAPAFSASTQSYKILAIHSYNKGLSWTDSIVKGIEEGLAESDLVIDLSHEFMDTKKNSSEEYLQRLSELYQLKYLNNPVDLIISSDDHAFQFLLKYHDTIFPKTPVVFCGVNAFSPAMLADTSFFTGIIEAYDMKATLNLALKFHPQASRFVAVLDQSLSARKNRENLEKVVPSLDRKMKLIYLENYSMEEVERDVARRGTSDIILWLGFGKDRLGHYFNFQQSSRRISAASHAPLYSFWDFHLGYGAVGGRLASGYFQGKTAAQRAEIILKGTPPDQIPVLTESPNRDMFDFVQLKRFGIPLDILPDNSIVINRPVSVYSTNKGVIWGVIGGFTLLVIIILLLLNILRQRKKSEQLLSQARNRFQRIFDEAAIALFEVDFSPVLTSLDVLEIGERKNVDHWLDAHKDLVFELAECCQVRACNRAAFALFGVTGLEEFVHSNGNTDELFTSKDFRYLLKSYLQGGGLQEWEATIKPVQGGKRYLVKRAQAIPGDATVIISGLDITDRKRSLEALERSEDRFRALFESAACGMALTSLKGFYLRVNSALCEMLGYTQEELEGKHWRDVTHPEDSEQSTRFLADLVNGKPIRPLEKRYIHREGRIIWVSLTVGRNLAADGTLLNYVSQMVDITRRKQIEARLRVREERYRQIFEADLSGFYIANPSGKLILCNQVFANMLGFSTVAEVVGRNVAPYYHRAKEWEDLVAGLWDGEKIENLEVEFLRTDGNTVNVLCNAIGRFDDDGELVEIQGHLVDISRQKKLENRLVRAEKMEAIGLMAGGVAHDLNNILSGIVSYPELILTTLDPEHPHYRPLNIIRESGQRAAAVVSDLLTVARSAANVREVHRFSTLIREYLESPEYLKLQEQYPQITLDFEDNNFDAFVNCSPVHIKKCLMNLVTNGMEAIDTSGTIRIRLEPGKIREEGQLLDAVLLEVADDGPGISKKDQDNIFEPFYTRKVMGKSGTGLGLAVVWNTVQDHGGRIKVESGEGGTVFSLLFPSCEQKNKDELQGGDGKIPSGHGERILVVDDEPLLRDIAVQILTELGYQVLTVESGEAAVSLLRKETVDLVLLDMFMEPGINGRETYSQILTIHPGQKAIIASGFSRSDDVRKAIRLGVGRFIEKPYTMEQLGRAVSLELAS